MGGKKKERYLERIETTKDKRGEAASEESYRSVQFF